MRRKYEGDTIPVRIAKVNSGTSSTNTNGTNGALGLDYQSIRVAVGTDRLGGSDSARNVAENRRVQKQCLEPLRSSTS